MDKVFYRDTWAEINLSAIKDNIQAVSRLYQGREVHVMAVVKANGYGHGAIEVAKVALDAGATHLAVALLDEAIELRQAGIVAPILVFGRIRPEDAVVAAKWQVILTVYQLEWLKVATESLPQDARIKVHLKIDTGMGRVGMRREEEVQSVLDFIQESTMFELNGIYTHFATADELNTSYVEKQYGRFLDILTLLEERMIQIPFIHCGNSATGLRFPEKVFNMFRFGISLYGLTPSPEITEELPINLKPAFALKTKIVQVKQLPVDEFISYGATYQTTKDEWIATIPIGYADGWIRHNSTKGGEVLVNGERAPFVGRICMDQCMIRLPRPVEVGTVVTLIGEDGKDSISMEEVAKRLDTINYEVPCIISARVPRLYVER